MATSSGWHTRPKSIYEVHLGSWKRDPSDPERLLSYGELAELTADRSGRKPPLYAGIAVFMIGSVVCTLAATVEGLILGRAIQGLGGAALMVKEGVLRNAPAPDVIFGLTIVLFSFVHSYAFSPPLAVPADPSSAAVPLVAALLPVPLPPRYRTRSWRGSPTTSGGSSWRRPQSSSAATTTSSGRPA